MNDPHCVTERHLYVFGFIVHEYARIESALTAFVASELNTPVHYAAILTAPLGARDLRDVISSIVRVPNAENSEHPYIHQIGDLLGRFQRLGTMRNHIAHSTWVPGRRPNSIKPFGINIRDKAPRFVGVDDTETDYTPEDFDNLGEQAQLLQEDVVKFLKEVGAFPPSTN